MRESDAKEKLCHFSMSKEPVKCCTKECMAWVKKTEYEDIKTEELNTTVLINKSDFLESKKVGNDYRVIRAKSKSFSVEITYGKIIKDDCGYCRGLNNG